MTPGEMIRAARTDAGISAAELGERIGSAGNTILRYERGELSVSIETMQAIGEALGLVLVMEYRPKGLADIQEHYRQMFRDTSGVGVQLLARALWRIRHGDHVEVDRHVLRDMTIALRERYGETVEREDALDVIEGG